MTAASRCPCGAESIWGPLATAADVAAWEAEHAACAAAEAPLSGVRIRFADEAEAQEVAAILRPWHVVGRVGVSLLVKPRHP